MVKIWNWKIVSNSEKDTKFYNQMEPYNEKINSQDL